MADFVAVIRRTVDGLSDNGPEMRAKVYDKARGAVRRQLENMKPRPSDDMIERQMVKLEAAIGEVENDHAEALPDFDTPAVGMVDVVPEGVAAPSEPVTPEPDVLEPVAPEPVAHEPVAVAPEPETFHQQVAESSYDVNRAAIEDEADAAQADEPLAPVHDAPAEDIEQPYLTPADEPAVEPSVEATYHSVEATYHNEDIYRDVEPSTEADTRNDDLYAQADVALSPLPADEAQALSSYPQEDRYVEAEPDAFSPEPREDVVSDPFVEPVEPVSTAALHSYEDEAVRQPVADEPEPDGYVASVPAAANDWELPEWNDPVPASAPVTAHLEEVRHEPADVVTMTDEIIDLADYQPLDPPPAAEAQADPAPGDPAHSWRWDDSDPFLQTAAAAAGDPADDATAPELREGSEPAISDWSWPVEKPAEEAPEQKTPARENWDDIDDLLHGADPLAVPVVAQSAAVADEMAAPARPASYRTEPKRSRINGPAIGIAAVLLLIAGGGGYAYWQNRDSVQAWVADMVASVTSSAPIATTTPDGTSGTETTTPATPQTEGSAQPAASTDVAAVSTSTKFTQRLQADGSELDTGPAPALTGEVSAEEGKSVAAQTEASKPPETASAETPTPTVPADGAQPDTAVPPVQSVPAGQPADAAPVQIPAGAQKMFLYEERLGQTAPTAIEGNVTWTLKDEAPEEGQRPEPVIQAQINVPDRGLTALMTIKRNADTSLPASHVIEFVFSLPETFEGGSIDNVQRVSMKRTEQDRGDALIAVPAKITEDFHMIALNDFPEAVTTNTELLRTRPWMDIPLTYRNGRRALLTLEKGTAGTDAFNKALQAWSNVARPAAAGQ